MASGVHRLEFQDRDFRVDRRGVQFRVPEKFLDVPDVRAAFE
jgi:hypothetical protein